MPSARLDEALAAAQRAQELIDLELKERDTQLLRAAEQAQRLAIRAIERAVTEERGS